MELRMGYSTCGLDCRTFSAKISGMRSTILLTRPEFCNESLRTAFEQLGMTVLTQPTIELLPPESWEPVDAVLRPMLDGTNLFDWIVFSSVNGVDFFFDRAKSFQNDFALPQAARIAVTGNGTDDALQERTGRRADIVPKTFDAEGMLQYLVPKAAGKRFLLLRASRGRDVLRPTLLEAGGIVTEIVVYRSVDVERAAPAILDKMECGEIDWTTATSSAIARSLGRLFGERLQRTKIVSISPLTSTTLRELGYPPFLEAKTASMSGIVNVLQPFTVCDHRSPFTT